VEQKKSTEWWFTCQTCEQRFTGEMRGGLANEWWSRVCDRAEDDGERLSSAGNLANSLLLQGKLAEAEKMEREVLAVTTQVLGADHPDTMSASGNLAASLSRQGKHAEAEKMEREVLAVKTRVLGAEHLNRRRSECKDCGGTSICEHNRVRSSRKDCGGASICEHNRVRSQCKDCGGAACWLPRAIWLHPSRAKESTLRRRRCSARCLQ